LFSCIASANILIAKSAGEPAGQAVQDLVKNVSEAISSSLPSFWEISKNFMDGKFNKVFLMPRLIDVFANE
jgi:exocyst complex component 2